MKRDPTDLVKQAHRLEAEALVLLGVDEAVVATVAPPKVRRTGTRAALVLGLREVHRMLRGSPATGGGYSVEVSGRVLVVARPAMQRAGRVLEWADACYWQVAQDSRPLVVRRRHKLGGDEEDAIQEGLEWLFKAAQRYRPEAGPWRRYAISWLMALATKRTHDRYQGAMTYRDWEVRLKAQQILRRARQQGVELSIGEVAEALGLDIRVLERALKVELPVSLDVPVGDGGNRTLADLVEDEDSLDDVGRLLSSEEVLVWLDLLPLDAAWTIIRRLGLGGTTPQFWEAIESELGVRRAHLAYRDGLDVLSRVASGEWSTPAVADTRSVARLLDLARLVEAVPLEDRARELRLHPFLFRLVEEVPLPGLVPAAPPAEEPVGASDVAAPVELQEGLRCA